MKIVKRNTWYIINGNLYSMGSNTDILITGNILLSNLSKNNLTVNSENFLEFLSTANLVSKEDGISNLILECVDGPITIKERVMYRNSVPNNVLNSFEACYSSTINHESNNLNEAYRIAVIDSPGLNHYHMAGSKICNVINIDNDQGEEESYLAIGSSKYIQFSKLEHRIDETPIYINAVVSILANPSVDLATCNIIHNEIDKNAIQLIIESDNIIKHKFVSTLRPIKLQKEYEIKNILREIIKEQPLLCTIEPVVYHSLKRKINKKAVKIGIEKTDDIDKSKFTIIQTGLTFPQEIIADVEHNIDLILNGTELFEYKINNKEGQPDILIKSNGKFLIYEIQNSFIGVTSIHENNKITIPEEVKRIQDVTTIN